MKIVHITFSLSAQGSLKLALRQNKLARDESVICVNDVFSVGPLTSIEEREKWLQTNLLKESNELALHKEMRLAWEKMLKIIPCNVDVWIWYGQNAHEQIGLRFAMSEFAKKCNMVFGVDTSVGLMRKGSAQVVKQTGEISPDYFLKLRAGAKLFTAEERTNLAQEWAVLQGNSSTLRVWRDGITHLDESEIDSIIMECAKRIAASNNDEQFLSTILVTDASDEIQDFVSEAYIEQRILRIAETGLFEILGDTADMYSYQLKYMPRNSTEA
ncbi:MAG: DUF1835 domain-containing protein [Lysinibacillus sp.]